MDGPKPWPKVNKSIKGIGLKTAQRIIVDLKDKIGKTGADEDIFSSLSNTKREEALSALVMLGFNKPAVEKTIDKIISEEKEISVEIVEPQPLEVIIDEVIADTNNNGNGAISITPTGGNEGFYTIFWSFF